MRRCLMMALSATSLAGCATITPPALPSSPAEAPASAAATHAGLVSAADPRAAEAGRDMLRAGGSATDAAIAMMLALTVVEPQSSGIGGGGFLIHHDGTSGRIDTIDGRETAPASATPLLFMANGQPKPFKAAYPGGTSVGVPGNMRLAEMAHKKWGKLPWKRLFEPAIKLARDGFTANESLHGVAKDYAAEWQNFPEIRALYAKDGTPLAVGTTVRNPALAAFLQRMADQGAEAFYRGENAQAISRAVAGAAENATRLSEADLASYQAKPRDAVCTTYRVYKICGMGPPSSGATTVFQILGMLERFDMAKLGASNPQSWHLIGEAMQLAYADRATYLGDPDFVTVPVQGLLDRNYIASRSALISPERSLNAYAPGTPPGAPPRLRSEPGDISGTTHFVARDRSGDVVTMTSTVEGIFGSQLIANGYVLNNELTDFSFAPQTDGYLVANRVQPGKRPLSSMSPTIVYGPDGQPLLTLGSAGGKRIIMHVAKTLIGVLDFGLPVDQAIALPNLFFTEDALLIENNSLGAALAPQMQRYGQPVRATALGSKVNALHHTPRGWVGAADPRSPGTALSE